jgi:hypothetical protein
LPYAGIIPAKPSGDHTPLGGFVSRERKSRPTFPRQIGHTPPQRDPVDPCSVLRLTGRDVMQLQARYLRQAKPSPSILFVIPDAQSRIGNDAV